MLPPSRKRKTHSFLCRNCILGLLYVAEICGTIQVGVHGTCHTAHAIKAKEGWRHVLGRHPCAHVWVGWKILQTCQLPNSPFPTSPTSRFFKKQRKQEKKEKNHTHTVPPPSGGLRPASTRFWQARYWQPQGPIFRFLCCCFKSKARLVMWEHSNTNTLTLLGKTRVGAKAFRWGLCPPSSPMEWSLVEKLWRGCHWEMPLAPRHLSPCTPAARVSLWGTGTERCSHQGQAGGTRGHQLVPAKQMWADVQNHTSFS